ncbi:hypothetical protein QCA50_011846 [Cerrena zonata]|uniref:Uncharacterized protein n=1 Tax=Cerrena zonata TaxID=2478898 RepID=A0AAW0FVU7_9APHY
MHVGCVKRRIFEAFRFSYTFLSCFDSILRLQYTIFSHSLIFVSHPIPSHPIVSLCLIDFIDSLIHISHPPRVHLEVWVQSSPSSLPPTPTLILVPFFFSYSLSSSHLTLTLTVIIPIDCRVLLDK